MTSLAYGLAAALILQTALFAWLLDRVQVRADRERQVLLQRIQAPEIAVAQHAVEAIAEDDPSPETDEDIREAVAEMERLEAEAAPWLS